MSKTVSPTPRNLSATDLIVGSAMLEVSGLGRSVRSESYDNDVATTNEKPLDRRIPATTVESRTASAV